MVYKDHFVAVVKVNGKVMREQDGVVRLPFGSEFSILLKNLNSTRAAVSVQIDGTDVMNKYRIIVPPNSGEELEGFMSADGSKVTNKFKFIEKTSEISEHRGDKAEDGLIRIEYQFEQKPATLEYHYTVRKPFVPSWHNTVYGGPMGGVDAIATNHVGPNEVSRGFESGMMGGASAACSSAPGDSAPVSKGPLRSAAPRRMTARPSTVDGITVKGSASDQTFKTASLGLMEDAKHVIVLSLRGKTEDERPVAKPITVDVRLKCETCGRSWKSSQKFCGNCGTSLVEY